MTLALVGGAVPAHRTCRTCRSPARRWTSPSLCPSSTWRASSPATSTSSPSRSTRSSWRGAGAQRVFALHRRKARDGRRLCDACERRGRARRHRDRVRPRAPVIGRGSTRTATAPSPTPSCAATCASTDVDFAYDRGQGRAARHLRSTPSRARRSPLSARPARARRPSRTSSTAFTTLPTARSATTASTSTRSRRRICAAPSALFCRTTNLFTGTVMENIRYGQSGRDGRGVHRARRSSPTRDDFITRLPRGLRHDADQPTARTSRRASGSCIAIARAAVADPPVMILDEATSSIDTRTEAHRAARHGRADGRAARCSSSRTACPPCSNSDVIMVLDHGRIIERGTPRRPHRRKGHLLSALYRRVRAGISRKSGLPVRPRFFVSLPERLLLFLADTL